MRREPARLLWHPAGWMLLLALLSCNSALAGRVLDYIRNTDLNDYALAVAVSASESPYAGGEDSSFAYPYLTSFRDSAFTDDWLLVREGDIGLRWVSKSNWELGLVGRVQTRGTGTSEAAELRGLDDRKWTLELAPIVGWRGWPLHVHFKTYTEITGRHDGLSTQLSFSLPYESSRGYVVPGVELIHHGEDYANYYYGVSESEARPLRAAYRTGDALNTKLKLRWGYALTEKWLLSGSIGLEFLDSEISDSPIVSEDALWSATIGVAYNSDIFQPRGSERAGRRQARFEFRLGAFSDSIDADFSLDSSAGAAGSKIDVTDVLGIPADQTVLDAEAVFRFATYHRLEIGYLDMARTGAKTLQQPVAFGDEQFAAATTVDSSFDSKLLRIGYAYSLLNDEQKEFGIMAGLHFSSVDLEIGSPATGQREKAAVTMPLPVVGLHGSVAVGKKASLGLRLQFFRMDFDRYEGSLNYFALALQRLIGEHFSIGIAYNLYDLNLDSHDDSLTGSLRVRHRGPALFISTAF